MRLRTSLAEAVAFTTVTSTLLISVIPNNEHILFVCLFTVEIALPCYLLCCMGKAKTSIEKLACVSALTYACWGSFLLFYPGSPGPYSGRLPVLCRWTWGWIAPIFHPTQLPALFPEVWGQVRRWNWGLIAIFYVAVLLENTSRHGSSAKHKETVLAMMLGLTFGLLWSWLGGVLAITTGLLMLTAASIRRDLRLFLWSRRYTWVLAVFWAFAVSVQVVDPPFPNLPGSTRIL